MKKKNIFLFAPWFMGVLFIVFAMAMAFATFYENDFGAKAAKSLVYNTKWFEFIMLLMIINLFGQIIQFKLYKKKKLTVLLFHLAFILILIGAGVTRYFGFEGIVHIRENASQNICRSVDSYVGFNIKDKEGGILYTDSKMLMVTSVKKAKYRKSVKVNNIDYSLKLKKYIPNAAETLVDSDTGTPIVSILVSKGTMERETFFLAEGEIKKVNGILFGFVEDDSVDVRILLQNDKFKLQSAHSVIARSMMSKESKTYEVGDIIPIEKKKVYRINEYMIVPEVTSISGAIKAINLDVNTQQTNRSALVFELKYGNKLKELNVWMGQGGNYTAEFVNENHIIQVGYSPLDIELPFSLILEDFILERYPGSSSPSSYKSEVVLVDESNGVNMPYAIYMNHILKYKGWRFFQSSYDKDERGTILSVNKDFMGTMITYTGYFILFLFIILSMLNKNTAFRSISKNFFKSSTGKLPALLVLFLSLTITANSQDMPTERQGRKFVVEKSRADEFGKILVQNHKGRTEPLYTLSSDILRKISRKTEFNGYTPMQVFLGLYFDFENWQNVPMVKISNGEIKNILGVQGNYVSFTDAVDLQTNVYKLTQYVDASYAKKPGDRSKFDKEVIKVDERLNICFMIYSGEFMKIFPVKNGTMKWHAPKDAYKFVSGSDDSLYLRNIVSLYGQGIRSGSQSGDYTQADEILKSILLYQRNFAQYELPGTTKVKAEIFYLKSKIYDRLFSYYVAVGFLLLIILLYGIISQNKRLHLVIKIFTGLLLVAFVFHTLGLAIRWYVSGHAPMSNGYESMIFISWVTVLAGFLFSKRSPFVLAATAVLSGFTLMVAHLSFMDPEITNLVPVLQSYWLTIHVSVITGSYGFLGLGAIIGCIVLILYSLTTQKNKNNIKDIIEELTVINYKTLTVGLFLLTIGTFLGAVWANESWGRYWGWDPKETWSLITVVIYSFVLHSRMINGLKGFYAFNVLALFGFASVLMTYFGVNYYLSGLHSYAAGDPVPVPKFVYVSVLILVSLSIYAFWKYKKNQLSDNK